MTINIGKIDIVGRMIVGSILIAGGFYSAFIIDNVYGLIGAAIGSILFMTAFIKWCPLYAILGIRSCPIHEKKSE